MKRFGENPKSDRLQRINNSLHYKDGSFKNVEKNWRNPDNVIIFRILKKMIFGPSSVKPSGELPNLKTDTDWFPKLVKL